MIDQLQLSLSLPGHNCMLSNFKEQVVTVNEFLGHLLSFLKSILKSRTGMQIVKNKSIEKFHTLDAHVQTNLSDTCIKQRYDIFHAPDLVLQ